MWQGGFVSEVSFFRREKEFSIVAIKGELSFRSENIERCAEKDSSMCRERAYCAENIVRHEKQRKEVGCGILFALHIILLYNYILWIFRKLMVSGTICVWITDIVRNDDGCSNDPIS